MNSTYSNIESLRAKLKNMDRSLTKYAYLGGDGNDQSFEQSFSDMAHIYLQDKAPSLVSSEQGFQVVERSEDDTKALGVIGFKINGMQMYAPVFFLRGELKGNELLYLADSDLFVPLKEAWVNEVFRRKPITIGDPVSRQAKGLIQPDLQLLSIPPSKTASYYPNWLADGIDQFCKMAGNTSDKTQAALKQLEDNVHYYTDVRPYIKLAGGKASKHLLDFLDEWPLIKHAFSRRYNGVEGVLKQMAEQAQIQKNSILNDLYQWNPDLHKKAGVQVISMSFSMTRGLPMGLSDNEKEHLIHNGYLVQDSRDESEVSKIVANNDDFASAANPTQTGIYDVLFEPHEIRTVAVLFPRSSMSYRDRCIVVDKSGSAFFAEANKIWCSKTYNRSDYKKWLDTQRLTASMPESWGYNSVVFLSDNGGVYGPYNLSGKTAPGEFRCSPVMDVWGDNESTADTLVINKLKGSAFYEDRHSVYIPGNYRVLTIPTSSTGDKQLCDYMSMNPTTPKNFKSACYQGAEPIKLLVRDGECSINNQPVTSAFEGFKSLITKYGLREKTASAFMKEAEQSRLHTARFFIKRADDPSKVKDESLSPTFPSIMDSSSNPMSFRGPLAPNGIGISRVDSPDGSDAYAYHPDSNSPAEDAMQVNKAIQSGQKEVFDVSMLKQLLTNSDTEAQVDKLLARLTKGMNSVGRLLFLFYWKGDQFESNYGPQKLPELEGNLKKSFETLGDIILFLKRNKVNQLDFEGAAPIDLSDNTD